MAYESTTVPIEKSQAEIRKLLNRFGAQSFQYAEGTTPDGTSMVAVQFNHYGHVVIMQVPLDDLNEVDFKTKAERSRTKTEAQIRAEAMEQEARRIWRVLAHSIKARMVSIEEGLEEFEQAFLAHLVDPTSHQTLWDRLKPAVHAGAFREGGGGLAALPAPKS